MENKENIELTVAKKCAASRENSRVGAIMALIMASVVGVLTALSLVPWVICSILNIVGAIVIAIPALVILACVVLGLVLLAALVITGILSGTSVLFYILYLIVLAILVIVVAIGCIAFEIAIYLSLILIFVISPIKFVNTIIGVVSAVITILLCIVAFAVASVGKRRAQRYSTLDKVNSDVVMCRVARTLSLSGAVILLAVLTIFMTVDIINGLLGALAAVPIGLLVLLLVTFFAISMV